jgi:hypothetical protein
MRPLRMSQVGGSCLELTKMNTCCVSVPCMGGHVDWGEEHAESSNTTPLFHLQRTPLFRLRDCTSTACLPPVAKTAALLLQPAQAAAADPAAAC